MERLLICKNCNTVVGRVLGAGEVCCCGQALLPLKMQSKVTLVPEINVKNNQVSINLNCKTKKFKGFIYLKTLLGGQRKVVNSQNNFCLLLCDDKPLSLTIYVENHGVFVKSFAEIYR